MFLPLAGALAVILLGRESRIPRFVAALFTLASFVLSVVVFLQFDRGSDQVQFVERIDWIPAINSQYFLGIDGLNLPLVVLTTLLGFLAVMVSWNVQHRVREYFMLLLLLETGVLGVFVSLDFLLFFLFWEVELIPMYLLIANWGSAPPNGRREYSAMKFLIYTLFGSAFMLVGLLVLGFSAGTFDLMALQGADLQGTVMPVGMIFTLIMIAFIVKLPVFPFHTWLPDAHTDAPTAVSVMLAGVLLKMGGYGMLRIGVGIFPDVVAQIAPLIAIFAVINILYGAVVTMFQKDLKRLVAYSSVSHMGYVLLGISAMSQIGLTGAALQLFTHGTITGMLFVVVGLVYDKTHTRQIPELGGLAKQLPFIATMMLLAGFASLGLPTMSGFVAEVVIFVGSFEVWPLAAILGVFGVVLASGYILWMIQRTFFGPAKERWNDLKDATIVEAISPIALLVVIFAVGLYPAVLTDLIGPAVALGL